MPAPQTYYTIVWTWTILAFLIFFLLLKVKAPFGRHSSRNWGPMVHNRLAWFIMELPALLTCPFFFFSGHLEKTAISYFFIALWILHYGNRVLIYPFRLKTKNKKMPVLIMLFAIVFNLTNGFICGAWLGTYTKVYTNIWLQTPYFWVGLLMFIAGFIGNIQSDNILLNLRKPGETTYKIPKGGLFRYISCPNHFCEMIEWLGYAIMLWAMPIFSFAIWTVANLLPRALAHHQWYLDHFENYPKDRKAVIPFLY